MLGDRSAFTDVEADVYFNHASISPMPRFVADAARRALDDYARLGAAAWPIYRDQRERLRTRLGTLVGAARSEVEIGLVPSTSQGIVDVALSLPWQRGDRVVLFRGEFPTNVTPWQRAADTFGLEVDWADAASFVDGDTDAALAAFDRVLEAGGGRCRLVAVSAVEFQTGYRMPLAELAERAHAHGAELFVDGIQAVGATPIDVDSEGIDYLVAGSHKWLMAPEGCGFVYVREACAERLVLRVAGWLSHDDPAPFLFAPGELRYDRPLRSRADVFEVGAQNTVGFAGLEASVDVILELGVPSIHRHVQQILDRCEAALEARGFRSLRGENPQARSTILSCRPPEDLDLTRVHEHLSAHGIACSIPDGCLRISPHWPNDAAQCAHFADALERM